MNFSTIFNRALCRLGRSRTCNRNDGPHKMLHIDDIMQSVYEECDGKTLSAMAQTAKIFYPLAIRVLWARAYEIDKLVDVAAEPLTRLLLGEEIIPENHRFQVERLRYCISSTRALRIIFEQQTEAVPKESPMYDLTNRAIDSAKRLLQALSRPGAWESITDVAPRSTTLGLFPKLRLLRLQCYSAAHFELGKQVLCDCLISLEVTLEWDMSPEEAEAAMDTIVERCPNLRHLDARLWQLQSVKMLRRLKLWTLAISYPFITEAEIDVLASLKTVRHLSVLAESDDPQITFKTAEHPIASDQNGSLDHLESLIIRTGDSLYLCLIMIRRLQEHKLRNLHIDAECIDDRWVRACVEAIPEHCRRLTSLYLHLRTQNSELKPGEQRNWYTVEPLGRCRDITSFQFTSSSKEDCTAFTWDDADLAAISQAWPRLDKLRLITLLNEYEYDVERYKPRITWRGLATLSKNCPRLKLVQLEFDATESGWPQDEVPVPAEDMEMFCLAWSRVDGSDYEAVARRINYIWPNASVGWGLWYGGQLELPNDHSEDIVNRFPQLEDKSYQEALKVAFAISHYLHYVKQENGPHHPVQLVDCDGSSDNTLQPQAPENIPADTEHIFPCRPLSKMKPRRTKTHWTG